MIMNLLYGDEFSKMPSLEKFFEDGILQNYVKTKNHDSWKGTHYEGYLKLSNTQMGVFGEILVSKIMIDAGSEVSQRINRGHDRIIDGYKTEIKFSLSTETDSFSFNHLACEKDWERAIILGVNSNDQYRMHWIYKEDFVNNINSDTCVFNHQQGGTESKNDDYIFSKNYSKLIEAKILQEMNTWMRDGRKKEKLLLWT